ncbi:glycosyltransferase [Dyadobacter diqingensis]|uniref:glycosyltransferase n=1 Tax=Dyadobacter diqingensis TaxID=2938121 RepID=UPI0020C1A940|nr:glycosyltransferase [Dyadobacter diqingensis]
MKTTIAGVVVTYNRLDLLKKCVEALRIQTHQLDAIIIINNGSTDGTKIWLSEQKDLVVYHQENLGASGGFYRGIKEANEKGFDWIWVMDDDAFCQKNAAVELTNAINRHNNNQDYCYWSNCNRDIEFDGIEKSVDKMMFVGFAISGKIVDKVGLPRRDFFLYHDDSEYALRIVDHNFKIIKLKDSIIDHGDLSHNQEYREINFFGKKFIFTQMSDFKLYYYIRNHLLINKLFSKRWFLALPISIKDYLLTLFLTEQKRVATKALWHGLVRKSGKYEP